MTNFSSKNFGAENKEIWGEWTPLSYSSRGLNPFGFKSIISNCCFNICIKTLIYLLTLSPKFKVSNTSLYGHSRVSNAFLKSNDSVILLTGFPFLYIEGITRWQEDMNLILEWQNNSLPRENKIHIFKPPCNALFMI